MIIIHGSLDNSLVLRGEYVCGEPVGDNLSGPMFILQRLPPKSSLSRVHTIFLKLNYIPVSLIFLIFVAFPFNVEFNEQGSIFLYVIHGCVIFNHDIHEDVVHASRLERVFFFFSFIPEGTVITW